MLQASFLLRSTLFPGFETKFPTIVVVSVLSTVPPVDFVLDVFDDVGVPVLQGSDW